MENYYSVYVVCPEPNKELLMATLDLLNYESFLETEDGFEAFISEPEFDEAGLNQLILDFEPAS
ncbi:hypothetical protein, partial [Umezakia ovalisporum]|uniref:hypothetical protein n=1 Tax=Umezakia ovalisporum TaxID=75695 RepID=UPI0039C70AEA